MELEEIIQLLSKYNLCDYCLGILSPSNRGSYDRRGRELRRQLGLLEEIPPSSCWLCEGLTSEFQEFTELVVDAIQEYEYDTFCIGCKVDDETLRRENKLLTSAGVEYQESPFKVMINREVTKRHNRILGKKQDFSNTDIKAYINTQKAG